MEESTATTASNLTTTTNDNLSKCTDSLISSTNFSTYKSSFSNSTIRTTLSIEEIESRRSGFEKFITSLPKICSPTICGTLNYKTPNSRFSSVCSTKMNDKKSETNDTSGYATSSLNNKDLKGDSTSCKETTNVMYIEIHLKRRSTRYLNNQMRIKTIKLVIRAK